jgi:hypothetical protein
MDVPGKLDTRSETPIDDDFPHCIPVSQRELEVIETYLGDLLDDMLGRPQ